MSTMLVALEITALGMGLVFAAIILLWWLMDLLTFFTTDKEQNISGQPTASLVQSPLSSDNDLKAKIAAIAVAVALAEQQTSPVRPLGDPPTALVSAWQLGTRTRQLYEKGTPVVRKPRKIG